MNPSILITGGAGFVGSHRFERLVEADHEALCADNFHTGANALGGQNPYRCRAGVVAKNNHAFGTVSFHPACHG